MSDTGAIDSAQGKGKEEAPSGMTDFLKEMASAHAGINLQKPDLPRLPELLNNRRDILPSNWQAPAPIAQDILSRQALLMVPKPEEAAAQPKPEAVRSAERDRLYSQLSADDGRKLDSMRLELSVASGVKEKAEKQTEIRSFLSTKLNGPTNEMGLQEIVSQQQLPELLKEIKRYRPQELAAIMQDARLKLINSTESGIPEASKRKDFAEMLKKFDERAAKRGLPDSEVLGTYLQLGRVLNPDFKIEHGNKSVLSRSMLANVADPYSIDQGGHNTCNVTTMQVRLHTQEPATALKVVADVVVGGHFVTADGTKIRPMSMDPDSEGKHDPVWDGGRNYASQIFQLTAINAYWNRRDTMPGGKTVGKGNIHYEQLPEGEFIFDTSVNPPQKLDMKAYGADHPWLDVYGVSEINQQLTGRPSRDFGIVRWVYPSEGDGVTKVITLGGFKDRLLELKKANAFPVIIEVDASKKPFGDGKGFGPHVVTITDYDPEKGLLDIDNQWGKGADHTGLPGQGPKATVEEIWSSMSQMPSMDFFLDKIKEGYKDVKWKDAVPPTVSALSMKGLTFGLGAGAPLALKGGLGYLREWGVPGAARALEISESRLGSAGLRVGSSLAALGAFAYINDLPAAFKQGNSYGVGKLTRVTGDWASFELGRGLTSKAVSWVPWAPARFGLSVAAGIAATTAFDKMLGEGSEVGGSWVYDRAREFFGTPHNRLPSVEKAFVPHDVLPMNPSPSHQLSELAKPSMTKYFSDKNTFVAPSFPNLEMPAKPAN